MSCLARIVLRLSTETLCVQARCCPSSSRIAVGECDPWYSWPLWLNHESITHLSSDPGHRWAICITGLSLNATTERSYYRPQRLLHTIQTPPDDAICTPSPPSSLFAYPACIRTRVSVHSCVNLYIILIVTFSTVTMSFSQLVSRSPCI